MLFIDEVHTLIGAGAVCAAPLVTFVACYQGFPSASEKQIFNCLSRWSLIQTCLCCSSPSVFWDGLGTTACMLACGLPDWCWCGVCYSSHHNYFELLHASMWLARLLTSFQQQHMNRAEFKQAIFLQVEGALDAANILKPALARGTLHCIGATTYEEYEKHMQVRKPCIECYACPATVTPCSRLGFCPLVSGRLWLSTCYSSVHSRYCIS